MISEDNMKKGNRDGSKVSVHKIRFVWTAAEISLGYQTKARAEIEIMAVVSDPAIRFRFMDKYLPMIEVYAC